MATLNHHPPKYENSPDDSTLMASFETWLLHIRSFAFLGSLPSMECPVVWSIHKTGQIIPIVLNGEVNDVSSCINTSLTEARRSVGSAVVAAVVLIFVKEHRQGDPSKDMMLVQFLTAKSHSPLKQMIVDHAGKPLRLWENYDEYSFRVDAIKKVIRKQKIASRVSQ